MNRMREQLRQRAQESRQQNARGHLGRDPHRILKQGKDFSGKLGSPQRGLWFREESHTQGNIFPLLIVLQSGKDVREAGRGSIQKISVLVCNSSFYFEMISSEESISLATFVCLDPSLARSSSVFRQLPSLPSPTPHAPQPSLSRALPPQAAHSGVFPSENSFLPDRRAGTSQQRKLSYLRIAKQPRGGAPHPLPPVGPVPGSVCHALER